MIELDLMRTFSIMGSDVSLFSSETAYGWQTCAEISSNFADKVIHNYHYLGDMFINIETAILAWQELNNRLLTQAEITEVTSLYNELLK